MVPVHPFVPVEMTLAQPTQLQPAADSFSTLCQRWELSRKAMSSCSVGRQQGAWWCSHTSPGSTPLCSRLLSVRSWLLRA
ncbi:hypothetical protein CgunFtcFv8_021525 [Champsocephalus gunnari]|uniref:Uncharacterized protein n=1 Tax=Champsocephalus gunnari TaxID=52237 RepID=A0AAN8HRQ7_CHAGU|nr:hypothetical protein CgunFtcFv8_021525 [Champsocephalus gunnari]